MKYYTLIKIVLLTFIITQCGPAQNKSNASAQVESKQLETIGSIEKMDDALDEIIKENAQIEILADGFTWSEGPVWVPSLNALLFSGTSEYR
ncbi:MAG: SMP-30/gluconolactonase/LRE family protein, partial [Bacteroidota bacterium]